MERLIGWAWLMVISFLIFIFIYTLRKAHRNEVIFFNNWADYWVSTLAPIISIIAALVINGTTENVPLMVAVLCGFIPTYHLVMAFKYNFHNHRWLMWGVFLSRVIISFLGLFLLYNSMNGGYRDKDGTYIPTNGLVNIGIMAGFLVWMRKLVNGDSVRECNYLDCSSRKVAIDETEN